MSRVCVALWLLSLSACTLRPISLDGRACPCAPGYRCDGARCVADEGADLAPAPPDLTAVRCPSDTALIPGGMGGLGSQANDPNAFPDEQPFHFVTLETFCADRTEVTVGDYRACVGAGTCTSPSRTPTTNANCNYTPTAADRESLPVTCVTWSQAKQFCEWAGDGHVHADGARRLPTEAEWERQARLFDRRTYPWGETTPTCAYANMSGCVATAPLALPVGSLPMGDSPSGQHDLAGNVSEWVSDFYSPTYYADACANGCVSPMGPATGLEKVRRGGSFYGQPVDVRAARRRSLDPADSDPDTGLRCISSPLP